MASDSTPSTSADLSVTLAPLLDGSSGEAIKTALDRIAALRIRHVQIAATLPGLRPRDLDRAARRDLVSSLRRRELSISGLDAWIPAEHFADPALADRAAEAVGQIIALAADLGRVPVSLVLPASQEISQLVVEQAQHAGVDLADHAAPPSPRENVGHGIDPAVWLSQGEDPIAAVHASGSRLVSARLVDLMHTGLRGPVGSSHDGRLDERGYKIALSVNGYRHPVVIDARQWSDPWRGVEQSIRAWNDV